MDDFSKWWDSEGRAHAVGKNGHENVARRAFAAGMAEGERLVLEFAEPPYVERERLHARNIAWLIKNRREARMAHLREKP